MASRAPSPYDHLMADLTMYTTSWCGYCRNLSAQLKRAGITWNEVNIEEDEAAAVKVAALNGGNKVVPTLEFADGATLTNPSLKEVQAKLAELASPGS